MKTYLYLKTGYSAGTYGNTGEYFTMIIFSEKNVYQLDFKGMYGAEHRVSDYLNSLGFIKQGDYTGNYGKITGENKNYGYNEKEAIEKLKEWINQ